MRLFYSQNDSKTAPLHNRRESVAVCAGRYQTKKSINKRRIYGRRYKTKSITKWHIPNEPLYTNMNRLRTTQVLMLLAMLCVAGAVYPQYRTQIADPHIHTLRVQYASEEDANGQVERPFLVLTDGVVDGSDSGNTLEVSFDEMSHDVHHYTYTIRHLNHDGRESSLTSGEFVHGFTTQDITDYEHSLNTQRSYTHYRFLFPNEDMQLTASGNYALQIYEDGDTDKTVAWVCFSVAEPLAGISLDVRPNTDIELSGRYQQIDLEVNTSALTVNSPDEIKVLVRQNGRIDNQVVLTRPTYMEHNRFRYREKALIFEGGNEYRHFDAYSVYFAGTGIDQIRYDNRDYHALLFADELRGTGAVYAGDVVSDKCGTPYMHEYDVDGQYRVNAERTDDSDTEAEYMWVHWTLPRQEPWFDGVIYIGGDLFLNALGMANRMQYDNENHCYYLTALVKQGGYDYQYWFVPKAGSVVGRNEPRGGAVTLQRTEGSHWQTENEYSVYVYYRPFGARYDRLVGVLVQKSAE